MNYSKNTKPSLRNRFAAWLTAALLICGFVGIFAIGIGIGRSTAPPTSEMEVESTTSEDIAKTEILLYGQPDGKIFTWDTGINYDPPGHFKALDVPLSEDLQRFTYNLCHAYGIDFTLVMAMMETESGFDESAVSSGGDYGLMQVNDVCEEYLNEQLGITDLLDPHSNIRASLFILRKLFDKYTSSTDVLMAYNMGESAAQMLWDEDVHDTVYTRKVLMAQQKYIEQLGGNW